MVCLGSAYWYHGTAGSAMRSRRRCDACGWRHGVFSHQRRLEPSRFQVRTSGLTRAAGARRTARWRI